MPKHEPWIPHLMLIEERDMADVKMGRIHRTKPLSLNPSIHSMHTAARAANWWIREIMKTSRSME